MNIKVKSFLSLGAQNLAQFSQSSIIFLSQIYRRSNILTKSTTSSKIARKKEWWDAFLKFQQSKLA